MSPVAAGWPYNLTCEASVSSPGSTPNFTWFGPVPLGPIVGQVNGPIFESTLDLGRLRESNGGEYTCQGSVDASVKNTSFNVIVMGKQ